MKQSKIILFLLIILSACKPTGINDLEKRNENWCWFVDKITGEGKWVPIGDETNLPDGDYTLFFCNGSIRQTGKLKNQKDCDTIFYYDLQGEIISKVLRLQDSTLKEFMPNGKYTSYYPTCEISSKGEFKNNKLIGTRIEYYKDGAIKTKTTAINDSTLLHIKYFETGIQSDSFKAINHIEEGLRKNWYPNGHLKTSQQLKNGKREGMCFWYHQNGQLESKGPYINDKENGYFVFYYENSKIKSEGRLTNGNGTEEGLVINYFENGQINSRANYSNGKRNGKSWFYYRNGKLSMCATSKHDVTTYYKSYDENGNLTEMYDGKETIDYSIK